MFLSGQVPPPPPFPVLERGILQSGAVPPIGHLAPQAVIRIGSRVGLADDLLGAGWHLICREGVVATLEPRDQAVLDLIGVRLLELDKINGIEDVEGRYEEFLDSAQADAVLVRPDFYVFGIAGSNMSISQLVAELQVKLGLRSRSGEEYTAKDAIANAT